MSFAKIGLFLGLPLVFAIPAHRPDNFPPYPYQPSGCPYGGCNSDRPLPTGATGTAPYGTGPPVTAATSYSAPSISMSSSTPSSTPSAPSTVSTSVYDSADSGYAATTTWEFTGSSLPSGLVPDTYFVARDSPHLLAHQFEAKNVAVSDEFLQLTVPGGQTGNVISSAEVATNFNVLYGSVRTYAILTETAGVCNGMFMFHSNSQETDIEWISDPQSGSNVGGIRKMEYTNQAVHHGGKSTYKTGTAPDDATSAVHEYRLDWSQNSTTYYVDGVLQQTMTTNVPSKAGSWVWNNWVNGDPNFTRGPPATDAVFKIQKIVMYYNPA